MATIDEIQTGIKQRLDTIRELHAFAMEPEKPDLPQAYPRLVDWLYDDRFEFGGEATMILHFDIWVLVQLTDFNTAQMKLNQYISPEGIRSVKQAIEADCTLGGVASSCRLTGGGSYGTTEIAALKVLATSMRLEVFA